MIRITVPYRGDKMSFVRNLSIRLRLALAFLLMVALLIANGLSGLLSARQVLSEI